jgi:multiple sugar transport system substrate-binding protein
MTLRVLAWDHPRATRPLAACAAAWLAATGEPVEITTRSLAAFGDEPPADDACDLVLIDHPHIGDAADRGAILPLDPLLDPATLDRLAADSVGESHDCYRYHNQQWAVAIDASCQALATSPVRVSADTPLGSWRDVTRFAETRPSLVAVPLTPAHAISAVLSLCAAHGDTPGAELLAEPGTLAWACRTLATLATLGPHDAFSWEPPAALAALAAGSVGVIALTYAYVGYDVVWHDAPRAEPDRPPGSILGGVGASVLAAAEDPPNAARFAAWMGSAAVQRDIILVCGGQPASATAWRAATSDAMFAAITDTISHSRVRPADAWWPAFQNAAGHLTRDRLAERDDPDTLARDLQDLYRHHRERTA